ncbi:MAG TPA: pYEATS domain-containing protein [Actinomycetota bacterium]|nr:pYEATS domain-containing protein [Actinomycetota bacterium]
MADIVPLLQTLSWVLLIAGLVWVFRDRLNPLFDAVAERLRYSRLKGPGGFEVGEDLRTLPAVEPGGRVAETSTFSETATVTATDDLVGQRKALYKDSRRVFLAHVLEPTKITGQKFEIFIYLVRHRGGDLEDVARAEFYLGKHWGDKVFEVEQSSGEPLGFRTAAYGPFLCVCRVTFSDGGTTLISRYIDFEMGELLRGQ